MSDRYRNDDWDTSKDAGDAADPKGECRAAVHLAHQDNPNGLTDDEMGRIVNARRAARNQPPYPVDSMRKRRTDLYHDSIVEPSGERRPSVETGRTMIVWKLVPEGEVPAVPYLRRADKPEPERQTLGWIEDLVADLRFHLEREGEPVELHTREGGWRDVIDYIPEEYL
jgi:hypothetical protein